MTTSVENLREFAKLNMDEKCFQKYIQLIEPGIKDLIKNYFGGWPSIESTVLQIIMRVNEVYKTPTSVIFDEDEDRTKYSDTVDLTKYKKFDHFSFKEKIDSLREDKIIGENTYKVLDHLRLKRNKRIHGFEPQFTDEDRELFELGYSMIHNVYVAESGHLDQNLKNQFNEYAEKTAILILKTIKQKEIS